MAPAIAEDEEQPVLGPAKTVEEQEEGSGGCKRPFLVEPVIFLFNLAYFGFATLNTEYLYDKVEREIIANFEESTNLTFVLTDAIDAEISTLSSNWALFTNLARGLPSLFSSLAILSMTETYGRNLALLLPTFGGLIQIIGYLIIESFDWNKGYLIIPSIFNGFSGYHQCLIGAGYLYVGDVGSVKNRSFRFILIQVCVTIAVSIANVVMGVLISVLTWFNCFLVVGAVYLFTALWILILLPESKSFSRVALLPQERCSWLINTLTAFKVYSRPRMDQTARPLLIAMGVVLAINALLSFGTGGIDTLYLLGSPFHYDSITIGNFISEQGLLFGLGPLMIVPVLLLCKFTDLGIILYGLLSGGFTFLILGLAQSQTTVFLSPLFGSLVGAVSAVPRSLMSKIVTADEQGALQATASSLNSLGELASNTILVAIYGATVSFYPGFTFLMVGIIYFMLFLLVSKFWCIARNNERANTPT